MTIEFVADGIGDPRYLVFDPDYSGPWVADTVHELIQETRSFDVATVYLLTPDVQITEVRVQSTDGDPDFLDWEVTLADGGDLVERIEYETTKMLLEDAYRTVYVNGFLQK